jgi:2,3,4,5-tetrahydropyridine-2,6-dicarboxylate N-succinyltransferase
MKMSDYVIKTDGFRYIDVATGKTIEAIYPGDDTFDRSCLAVKYGLIKNERFEIEVEVVNNVVTSTEDAYLRLQLISRRLMKPNSMKLDGVFDYLPNVAWTSAGPVFPTDITKLRSLVAKEYHHLSIFSVDKFPRMTDYIVPTGTRIADADRVRLGAYLAEGTTIMHEGFVNYNAGTLGKSMVEGRITPGVTVGEGSDVGAGASIMGTLSGGGRLQNAIGKGSLLGANAGIGISLGDDCIVEAGLYITAGTKVRLPDGTIEYARNLSGKNGLLFRRNSQTGVVEVLPSKKGAWGNINPMLHNNNE